MPDTPVIRWPFDNTSLPDAHQPHPTPEMPSRVDDSQPLPGTHSKGRILPETPLECIRSKDLKYEFTRLGLLGKGAYSRVWEVVDNQSKRSACKVLAKTSLKTKRAKTWLYAEIKIHTSMKHPNIVQFGECFEDDENVYITLQLFPRGSLLDMHRRRRRFTEPEARFFVIQLIGACSYMHRNQVIHRDLKPGNIFIDINMNISVGDFGFATLVECPGERKRTLCGTPNYIAPEVLSNIGHSYEVDIWAIGVILYTLVVGRPPFQTQDVQNIYKRIRHNYYIFPAGRVVSPEVKNLITAILVQNPHERPSLYEIIEHDFFVEGTVPSHLPLSAHESEPVFCITPEASKQNLRWLKRSALLDEVQRIPTIQTEELTISDAQQEIELQVGDCQER